MAADRKLAGFAEHGFKLSAWAGDEQAVGDCIFCEKGGHFYINSKTKAWDCKRCQRSGSFQGFLEQVVELRCPAPTSALKVLAQDRGLAVGTLRRWNIGWDGIQYLIPVLSYEGKLQDVRRYRLGRRTRSTAGCKTGLLGAHHLATSATSREVVYLDEGEWDAFAWEEVLQGAGEPGLVVATPGAGVFKEVWAAVLQGRKVRVLYDNDAQGQQGDIRVFRSLRGLCPDLQFLHWPDSLPEHFDIRALYQQLGRSKKQTFRAVRKLLRPQPRQSLTEDSSAILGDTIRGEAEPTGEGLSPTQTIRGYRKWLYLIDSTVIDVLMGTVLANRIPGDPLWLMLVAPSGGTKSELLMSLDESPLITSVTTMTPHALISGSTAGDTDPSFIGLLDGRVLVLKDFTTILSQNPIARDEILGILRDAYDGKISKRFGHGKPREYRSTFGLIAGVTPAVDSYTQFHGSLGERFLRYRVWEDEGLDTQKDMIDQALRNIPQKVRMRKELAELSTRTLDRGVDLEEAPMPDEENRVYIRNLAQAAAVLRGTVVRERYTGDILFRPSPEIGTRLAVQLAKLGTGIALFRREDEFSDSTRTALCRVTLDTIPGIAAHVAETVYRLQESPKAEFLSERVIFAKCRLPERTIQRTLEDLHVLKAVQRRSGHMMANRWRLYPGLFRLLRDVQLFERGHHAKKSAKENQKKVPRRVRAGD